MTFDAHALAIGISRYRHVTPLPEVKDAEDVAALLVDPGLCGYPAANVTCLLEERATRGAILEALDAIARQSTTSSSVFVYFSGHGGRASGDDETCYLLPCDGEDETDQALAATGISGPELSAKLRAIPAMRLTIVLDCCRASGVAEPKDVGRRPFVPVLPTEGLALLASGRGRAVLAASRKDGSALVWPGERNGVFTRHLLDGLRGGALGAGGVIRVCDLFHYVQQRVLAEGIAQHPVFKAELEENYPVALHRGGVPPALDVPPSTDGFAYDAFVSYRQADPTDRAWTERVLVPSLKARGLRLCLERYNFRLGEPRIREIEHAVQTSRYTIGVFTPAYLDGAFEDFEALLAAHKAIEDKAPRFIPVVRRRCGLSLAQRMTSVLDLSDDDEVDSGLERLALALREPPHHRLAA